VVPVSQPVTRDVTDYVDFTGRTDAVESVGVRARVTGYLVKVPFAEGSEVRGDDRLRGASRLLGLLGAPEGALLAAADLYPGQLQAGDLLFEIDPRPYKAQLDQAVAQVALNQSQRKLAKAIYARDVALANKNAISQQELEQDLASVEEAEARVNASLASLEVYKLNLEFTKVTSPIDGRVSRYFLTFGNLVVQDQTLLTTVVSLDPVYAYFDVDEPTLLMVRKAINAGKIALPKIGADVPVFMGLQGEEGYPHRGSINFVNNVVNPSTGTISVRGVFPNPKPKNGTRLLSPGMFVRIRLPIGEAHPALLVIDRAVGSDQGLKFVYVLTTDDKIEYRRVKTGPLQDDGLRVIENGLKAGDRVVVGALQQVRPNMQVSPERMPMPTLGPGEEQPGVPNRPQPPPPGQQGKK
jgi:multidrug efflux system membrane fusion protein